MVKARELVEQALTQLFDIEELSWSSEEILGYIDEAQLAVVRTKPDANALYESVQLAPGIRQKLPDQGVLLIDLVRSTGADGNSFDASVTAVQRHVMDRAVPGWQQEPPAMAVVHYMYEPRDPMHFDVYPAQPDPAGFVDMVYGAWPAKIASPDDEIALDRIYHSAILDYALYRAHAKPSDAADPNQANAYLQAHRQALGIQAQGEATHQTGRQQTEEIR